MKSALPAMRRHRQPPQGPRAANRRSTPRFPVQVRTLVSDKSAITEQAGVILDLSLAGCQVRAPISVYPTLAMELQIYAPDVDRPIMIERAEVQWVKGDTFGLHFINVLKAEFGRLGWVIAKAAENGEHIS